MHLTHKLYPSCLNLISGATLVALGAEIPDTISAVALSRNGFTHGAIAGAIGSQVINISLGIGLPALIMCATGKGRFVFAHLY